MITDTNESKTLTKHVLWEFKCIFDSKKLIQINGGIVINSDVNKKNVIYVKKTVFGILVHAGVKIENI